MKTVLLYPDSGGRFVIDEHSSDLTVVDIQDLGQDIKRILFPGAVFIIREKRREINSIRLSHLVHPENIPRDLKGSYSCRNHPAAETHDSFSAEDVSFFF